MERMEMDISYFEDVMLPKSVAPNPEENVKVARNMKHKAGDIVLCSYPKSGSHWLQNMLRCLVRPDNQADAMVDIALIEFSTHANMQAMPTPRVLFTHLHPDRMPEEHTKKRGKMVLLLRNPKDIGVSAYHHLRRSVTIKNAQSQEDQLESYISGKVPYGDVFDYYYAWQEAIKEDIFDIQYFYYEDFKDNPVETLTRLAKHIGVAKSEEDLKAIVEECSLDNLRKKVDIDSIPVHLLDKNKEMVIYRKGIIGDWKNYFTVAQNERYEKVMEEKMRKITMFKFRFVSNTE